MKIPYDWQYDFIGKIEDAWQTHRNVLARADTGAGKTLMLSEIVRKHVGASCVMAHRHELVSQLSKALAEQGIYHDLIASADTRRAIATEHVAEFGRCYWRVGAACRVASVDTLIRARGFESWAAQVTLVVIDEGHHAVRGNKWSRALALFTNPARRLLLPTATPQRADGKGLGSHADGYADTMVQAPPMRWLINNGYLTDYDIVCPTSDLAVMSEPGANGDWSPTQLREAARRSHIVGDVVQHYQRWAMGKRCVTFCTDVETAAETTAAFLLAGIPTATLTGDTDPGVRRDIIKRLASGQLLNICAVDIISEGFDLPAIEAVIMARPTQSLALYMQQFGRALRTMLGKVRAIIIDCVSNIVRHGGPPDKPRPWSLDRRDKRGKPDGEKPEPIRICTGTPEAPGCSKPYLASKPDCPFCGTRPPMPVGRRGPEQVEGEVGLMDAETLARIRGEIATVDATVYEESARLRARHVPEIGVAAGANRHLRRQAAQATLRDTMATWGGLRHAEGYSDARMQRRFWHGFGISVLEAQALDTADAEALRIRIDRSVMDDYEGV